MSELSADLKALLDRVAEGAARSCGADDARVFLLEAQERSSLPSAASFRR